MLAKKRTSFLYLFVSLGLVLVLSGCSLEATLVDLSKLPDNPVSAQRAEPDFVASEVVTTGNGSEVRGSFGEVSEKIQLANSVVIEGAFYE